MSAKADAWCGSRSPSLQAGARGPKGALGAFLELLADIAIEATEAEREEPQMGIIKLDEGRTDGRTGRSRTRSAPGVTPPVAEGEEAAASWREDRRSLVYHSGRTESLSPDAA